MTMVTRRQSQINVRQCHCTGAVWDNVTLHRSSMGQCDTAPEQCAWGQWDTELEQRGTMGHCTGTLSGELHERRKKLPEIIRS